MNSRDILHCDRAAVILASAATAFHLLTTRGYGIFRDELYYLACADHLAWGYVDHPPLVAVFAWFLKHLLGTSLFALRFVPALAAGVLVLLTAAIARQFGSGRFAQLLAGVAVALAPQYVGMLSIYSMNAFDLVVWSALILLVVRILTTDDRRLWLPFGVLVGIGFENKLSVLFLCFGLAVGFITTRQWKHLRERWLWTSVGLAGLLIAPHILWQIANGWPTAEFIRNATEGKNVAYAPLEFISEQIMMMNPVALPLWLLGLGGLLLARRFRPYQALGWAYLAILLLMMTRGSKPYYLSPIYPALFAAGAVIVDCAAERWGGNWIRGPVLVTIVLSGLALVPFAKPLLPVEKYLAYASALGVEPGSDEQHSLAHLPQFFADMHGWQEMAEAVAMVHEALPARDREKACIFAQNYGQAGAMDFFGPTLGLPPVISGHNSYWLWGPGLSSGDVVIVIGGMREDHLKAFEEVNEAGFFDCRNCMPYEDEQTLWIARRLRAPVAQVWPSVKHYD